MKNLIILICVILSFNIFAERYEGGYVDGVWFPLYRNNLSDRICLEPNGGGEGRMGCSGGEFTGYVFFKGSITVIGIAEIDDTILFKVSDFNMIDEEGNSYNPINYPAEKKNKDREYFPVFKVSKETIKKILKNKNLNFKYDGKDWEEEYFVNDYSIIPISELKKNKYDKETLKSFTKKKLKFLGIEKMKLDIEYIRSSYYRTDDNFDLEIDY